MTYIDALFQYWIDAEWYVALAMSVAVNIAVFTVTAFVLDGAISKLATDYNVGKFIDGRPVKPDQKKMEIRNGMAACTIFAVGSLLTRELFEGVWPLTFVDLFIQLITFIIFYESYSYFVHRLLHAKPFLKIHAVHHRSIRVNPWSAYSVHPVEAMLIGMSAPVFMALFPLSLGVAFVLHVFGMMFTIFLHSNYGLDVGSKMVRAVSGYPAYHSAHHLSGKVNFGFVNSFWDGFFRTRSKSC